MTKHTPGPWLTRGTDVCYISQHADQTFGMAVSLATTYGENDEANARLIAAAPELLALLKELAAEWAYYTDAEIDAEIEQGNEMLEPVKRARAAIAKAVGETA